MKKVFCMMLCMILVSLCACGSASSEMIPDEDVTIVGGSWKTWKWYGFTQRNNNGTEENVYIDSNAEEGIVYLVKDEDSYNVIQEIKLNHGPLKDQTYVEQNTRFEDLNSDGYDDVIIPDIVDGAELNEVYIYDSSKSEYVYSKNDSFINENVTTGYEVIEGSTLSEVYEPIVSKAAEVNPQNQYFMYDINGDGYIHLLIQESDDNSWSVYAPLYDGGVIVGTSCEGVIPGSEDGDMAVDDEGKLLMNRCIQGVRYVYIITTFEGQVQTEEIYCQEEEEYGFTGTAYVTRPVTDLEGLKEIY